MISKLGMPLQPVTSTFQTAKRQLTRMVTKAMPVKSVYAQSSCPTDLLSELRGCPIKVPIFSFKGQHFWCRLISIHDGDSVHVIVKVHGELSRLVVRLMGIDTPEIRSKDDDEKRLAVLARNRVATWASPEHFSLNGEYTEKEIKSILWENPVVLYMLCEDADKYGRTLSQLFKDSEMKDCLNSVLLAEGHGDTYEGGTKVRSWSD